MATARTWWWVGAGSVAAATVVGGVLVYRARKAKSSPEASTPDPQNQDVSTFCDPDAAYRTERYNWEIILGLREGSMTFAPGSSHVVDCPDEWPAIEARVERELGVSGATIGAIARGDQPKPYR